MVDRVFFTEKLRRFESVWPSWGFLTTRQMWVANSHLSTLTWILQNRNRSNATWEHSTHFTVSFIPNGFIGVCYMILSPSLHSQCTVIVPHSGLAQVLGLPEYVASTASHDHKQAVQRTVLNRHRRGRYVRPQTTTQAKIPPGLDLRILTSWYLQPITELRRARWNNCSWMMKPSFDFYRRLSITKHKR
jgi:hypothetical protein